jgi:hypothetical protein
MISNANNMFDPSLTFWSLLIRSQDNHNLSIIILRDCAPTLFRFVFVGNQQIQNSSSERSNIWTTEIFEHMPTGVRWNPTLSREIQTLLSIILRHTSASEKIWQSLRFYKTRNLENYRTIIKSNFDKYTIQFPTSIRGKSWNTCPNV